MASEPFRVIVADPAWLFGDALPGETRGASNQYECMNMHAICSLTNDCGGHIMGQPIADDAILFLWRVAALQQAALTVVRAWDFTVKTDLVWLKKTADGLRWFGMGRTLRSEHETCLVCTRGAPKLKNHSTRSTFVTDLDLAGLSAKAGRHSEKPEEFYQIVEALTEGPRLELFARKRRPGWVSIGNELGAA
jgi:N6-adenosine-specific RNA methylase IME4